LIYFCIYVSDSDVPVAPEPPDIVMQVITPEKKTPGRRPKTIEKQATGDKASPEQMVPKPSLPESIGSIPETPPKPKPGRPRKKKDLPTESEQKDGTNQATNTDDNKTQNSSSGNEKTAASDQSGTIKKRSPGRPRKHFDGGKKGSGDDDKSPERPRKIDKNTDPCISPERPEKNEEKKMDVVKNQVSEGTQVSVADEGVQADSTQVSEGTQSEASVCENKKLCTSATQTCDDDFKVLVPVARVEKDVQTCTSTSQTQTPPIEELGDSPIGPKFQKEFEQFINQRSDDDVEADAKSVDVEKVDKSDSKETLVTPKVIDEATTSGEKTCNVALSDDVASSTSVLKMSASKRSSCSPQSLTPVKPNQTEDSEVEIISSSSTTKKSSLKRSGGSGRRCDPNKVDPILEKYLKKSGASEAVAADDGCQECSKLQDKPPRKKKKCNSQDTKLKSGTVVSLNKVKFSGLPKGKPGRRQKGKRSRKRKKPEPPTPSPPPAKRGRGRKTKGNPGRPSKVKPVKAPVDKKVPEPIVCDSSEYSSESDYVEEHRVDSKSLTREYHPLPVPPRKRRHRRDVGEKVVKKKRKKDR
jgi:hypothetical protein